MPRKSADVLVPIDQSAMGGYLAMPSGDPHGALVLIQEIFGVTPAMRAIADDFAGEGYAVLVPDIYWRLQPNLNLGNGENPEEREAAVDYASRYDEVLGADDIIAGLEWLTACLNRKGKPAVLGFCLGGRMAVRVAAKADLACMVSMYGVGLDKLTAEIQAITCPVQFHFGENDNHNPTGTIEAVRASITRRQHPFDQFFTYPDAEHAFYNRFRLDRFDEAAHQLAHTRILGFLHQHAGPAMA